MHAVLLPLLGRFSANLAEVSYRAAFVVLLILLLQRLLRGMIPASARSNLWLVLVVYLLLPWTPIHRFSFHQASSLIEQQGGLKISPAWAEGWDFSEPSKAESAYAPTASLPSPASWGWSESLTLAWLLGSVGMVSYLAIGSLGVRRLVARSLPCHDRRVLQLFDACREEAQAGTRTELRLCKQLTGPVVVGIWRPRVLIPETLPSLLTDESLRHVFLHELGHVRRKDILQGWLLGWLLALHWFNPLLWYACRRQRIDRELACDAFVLEHADGVTARTYGHTILHLLEQYQGPVVCPNTAGILEYKSEIKTRIAMIASYTTVPVWKRLVSTTVCLLLAAFILSRPPELRANTPATPDSPAPGFLARTAPNGHYEDDVALPFADDPELIGSWLSVDFVKSPTAFKPGTRASKVALFLRELTVLPNGKTNHAWTWTRNYLLHAGDKTASRYEYLRIDGETYLALEWKSGDYVVSHDKPKYYILRKAKPGDADSAAANAPKAIEDKIDLPFVDDPALLGSWSSVDFVPTPDDFSPGKKRFKGELFLKDLAFQPEGKLPQAFLAWTKGVLIHKGNKTASHYEIRSIEGATYLFLEWKSGDYTLRGMKPKYYVLRKG